jgi:intracellular septation protein A
MDVSYWWYPSLRVPLDGHDVRIRARASLKGLWTEVFVDGRKVSSDMTPVLGDAAVRNHRHRIELPGTAPVEIEAGYVGLWAIGALVRREGVLIHETHPGRKVAFPDQYRELTVNSTFTGEKWRANRLPLAVDVLSGLLFFAVAKLFGLQSAAIVAAVVGVLLVVGERVLKRDLTGGLALFGIVMLLISAGFAWIFDDEEIIKLKGTFTGLIASGLFLGDGLLGGRRLAGKLVRYLPWDDISAGRLGIGLGLTGLVMAGLNFAVARLASTDVWLVYTTFLDTPISMAMIFLVFAYARGKLGGRARTEALG